MDVEVFRLQPGMDLKKELVNKIALKKQSAYLVGGIGSLTKLNIRFANEDVVENLNGPFEVCSMQGSLSDSGAHIHIVVSNKTGEVLGGHLCDGSIIKTTAECILVWLNSIQLTREFDQQTGYSELVIKCKK